MKNLKSWKGWNGDNNIKYHTITSEFEIIISNLSGKKVNVKINANRDFVSELL